MLNFIKKIFGNNPIDSSDTSVFECKICHNIFAANEMPCEEYPMCEACFLQSGDYLDSFQQRIAELQEKANNAGRDGNYCEQHNFLKLTLECLNDYKETYYDKGINIIKQDINQLIDQVQEICDEAEKECAELKQHNIVLGVNNTSFTEEEWLSLQRMQDKALNNAVSLCNTIDEVGLGFSDGRSLETELLQSMLSLLIRLALIDGEIDETEKQIICDFLNMDDINYSIEAVKKSSRGNDPFPLEIPSCMEVFVNGDKTLIRAGKSGTTVSSVISLIKQLGINFLYRSCTDNNPKKVAGLYRYLLNLNHYVKRNGLATVSLEEFRVVDTKEVNRSNDVNSQNPEES